MLAGFTPPVTQAADDSATQTGDARWNLVFADSFGGSAIDESEWVVFDGPGPRARENVIVRNGKLLLRTRQIDGEWLAAGVGSSRAVVQQYGKYVARVKVEKGAGTRAVALLWPNDGSWPPEVDFFEIGGDDPRRQTNRITNHYPPGNQMEHLSKPGDYTKWHNVGVEWTADAMKFTLDGRVIGTITENIPQQPMWFGLQSGLETGQYAPSPDNYKSVDYKAKWVKVYDLA